MKTFPNRYGGQSTFVALTAEDIAQFTPQERRELELDIQRRVEAARLQQQLHDNAEPHR